jgi:hypothetical protein
VAETLIRFQTAVASSDGTLYDAKACGAESRRLWEGWIEFTPVHGGKPIRSSRETTQPNRRDLDYWATGLTPVYLEGALRRALSGPVTVSVPRAERPAFDGPAPSVRHAPGASGQSALDPFSVYEKGEQLLRRQLAALSAWHLVNIVEDYGLSAELLDSLNRRSAAYLIDVIVKAVREREGAVDR